MLVEDLSSDSIAYEFSTVAMFWIVSGKQTHTLILRDSEIGLTHGPEKGFVDGRLPNLSAGRIGPDSAQLLTWNVFAV